MNKELAAALANYVKHLNSVISSISDSHYLNGSSNSAIKALNASGAALIVQIEEAAKPPATPPEVRGSPAAP